MASVRYGLINAELPQACYVMLLVHLTNSRAEAFACDLADMTGDRIARLFYCLYSGGGCNDEERDKFHTALGQSHSWHGQMIRSQLDADDAKATIKQLYEAFLTDANASGDGKSLERFDKAQRCRNQGVIYLASVSILCQGYLLEQSVPGGGLASPSKDEPKEIGDIRKFSATLKLPRPVAEVCKEVESAGYWNIFNAGPKLCDEFKAEWDLNEGYGDAAPLFVKIAAGQGVDDLAVVLKGYCAIAKRLGAMS
jgi:hypothetical protein